MRLQKSFFLNIALMYANEQSTCIRKKVGALIVKDGRIISTGYNGVTKNSKHCNEIFKNHDITNNEFRIEHAKFSDRYESHAEMNSITYCSKQGIETNNSEMYVTVSPCLTCAKAIISAGITSVYFYELYDRYPEGIEYLKENKILVEKINLDYLYEKKII